MSAKGLIEVVTCLGRGDEERPDTVGADAESGVVETGGEAPKTTTTGRKRGTSQKEIQVLTDRLQELETKVQNMERFQLKVNSQILHRLSVIECERERCLPLSCPDDDAPDGIFGIFDLPDDILEEGLDAFDLRAPPSPQKEIGPLHQGEDVPRHGAM